MLNYQRVNHPVIGAPPILMGHRGGRWLLHRAASCRILPCCGPCFPPRMVSTCDMATGSAGPSIMTIIRTMYNHKNINSTKHVIIMYNNIMKRRLIITSSTAQGGGGSFKNRKLIGAVGCCESRMAERSHWWTERCLRSPLFLSLSLATYLPIYVSIYLSTYLSIDRSIYLSICLTIYLSISLSIHLFIYLSIYLSLSLSSNYLSIYLSSYLAIYLSNLV